MNTNNFEIEHKYLIRYPSPEILQRAEKIFEIEQAYLTVKQKGVNRRVRKRCSDSGKEFFYTEKQYVSDLRRVEIENTISEEEYIKLLSERDPFRNVIFKKRYLLAYRGQLFEIDLFPFWSDRAFMELEVETEDQKVELPEDIQVIREITSDKRYTNSSLAKEIPYERI